MSLILQCGRPMHSPYPGLWEKWTARPTKAQLAELRKLAPKLSDVPDTKLVRIAINGSKFELGDFKQSEIRDGNLESRLRGLGLDVERVVA